MKVEGFGNKYTIYFAVYLKKIYQLKNRNNKMTFYNIFIYYFILISYIYYFLHMFFFCILTANQT